jgi:hypothetical protein
MGLAPVVFKKLLGRQLEVGSRLLVNATSLPDSQGEYILDDHVSEPSPLARSKEGAELGKRVWDELSQILEAASPGITQNL